MTDTLCHCGRPYRHTGHHWGPNHRDHHTGNPVGRPNNKSLRELIAYEIDRYNVTLRETPLKIEQMQAAIKEAEGRLPHLLALRDVYGTVPKAKPAEVPTPNPAPVPKVVPVVADASSSAGLPPNCPCGYKRGHPGPHRQPDDTRTDADFAPIEASYSDVLVWVNEQTVPIRFRSWDDLPGVNVLREDMQLPTFKRSFTKQRAVA